MPQRPENKHVRPWEEKSDREVICLFSQSLLISQRDAFASEQFHTPSIILLFLATQRSLLKESAFQTTESFAR